jgi:acyl carrier protein
VLQMTREELLVGLNELLETDQPLTGHEELSGLGTWDSMAVIGFMSLVDEARGVTLAPSAIDSCKTVNDLVELALGRASS